ncbi:hypothetical protein D9M73_295990 [compost metagenome]
MVGQVIAEVLGHALGQRGRQHTLACRDTLADLRQQVVDLGQRRAHLYLRVDQPGRTHHLLHHAPGMLSLVGARSGRNKNGLRADILPLVETHRPVVQR